MDIEKLRKLNSDICIKHVEDNSFLEYGRVLEDYDFSEVIEYMHNHTDIPEESNIYKTSVAEMEAAAIYEVLQKELYGEMPIQIGYCNGRNSTLNGLEYHKGNEINVAVTDLLLMLGRIQDISNNCYPSGKVEAFYIPRNTAVELYGTTLHFAPCKTASEGFKCVVILPRGTNEALCNMAPPKGEGSLLFAKNKWLLAHPERKQLIVRGAYPGITGINLEIRFE